MRTIIFIDGENFMHQVRDMLWKRKLIRNREELANYDIRSLLGQVLPEVDAKRVKIYYYAAKIHLSEQSDSLKERTETIKAWNERLKEALKLQRINFVEAGHLLVREGKRCTVCGHREPVLLEKGVDVQLATDLIRTSGDNVQLVLLSSDGDLVPAVVEAKRRGAKVTYLGFRGVRNLNLARMADARFTIISKQVESVFKLGRKNLAAAKPADKPKNQQDSPQTHKPNEPNSG